MDQAPETPADGKGKASRKPSSFKNELIRFIVIMILAILLCNDVFAFHVIPSESMEPTIRTKSFALCWRLPCMLGTYEPQYGDIVSFRSTEKKRILIKRVVGLPGDTIEFEDGYVIGNGTQIEEPYLMQQGVTTYTHDACTYIVTGNSVFVLGDNREHSADSRSLMNPYVSYDDLYSKMLFSIPLP